MSNVLGGLNFDKQWQDYVPYFLHIVQQLEKKGAKAISFQPDEPVVFEDESYVMGKRLCSASKEEGLAQ